MTSGLLRGVLVSVVLTVWSSTLFADVATPNLKSINVVLKALVDAALVANADIAADVDHVAFFIDPQRTNTDQYRLGVELNAGFKKTAWSSAGSSLQMRVFGQPKFRSGQMTHYMGQGQLVIKTDTFKFFKFYLIKGLEVGGPIYNECQIPQKYLPPEFCARMRHVRSLQNMNQLVEWFDGQVGLARGAELLKADAFRHQMLQVQDQLTRGDLSQRERAELERRYLYLKREMDEANRNASDMVEIQKHLRHPDQDNSGQPIWNLTWGETEWDKSDLVIGPVALAFNAKSVSLGLTVAVRADSDTSEALRDSVVNTLNQLTHLSETERLDMIEFISEYIRWAYAVIVKGDFR